jgi:hypothetical protein
LAPYEKTALFASIDISTGRAIPAIAARRDDAERQDLPLWMALPWKNAAVIEEINSTNPRRTPMN